MNVVYFLEKEKADELKSLGFKYKETEFENRKAYEFFGTDALMKELHSKYSDGSFFVVKNYCF